MLVSGTASIRGETTCHHEDLDPQLEETIDNLAAVVASGFGKTGGDFNLKDSYRSLLAHYRHLRVYCPRIHDLDPVVERLQLEFENVQRIELVQSDLCRERLLVEIEGWADLEPISIP